VFSLVPDTSRLPVHVSHAQEEGCVCVCVCVCVCLGLVDDDDDTDVVMLPLVLCVGEDLGIITYLVNAFELIRVCVLASSNG